MLSCYLIVLVWAVRMVNILKKRRAVPRAAMLETSFYWLSVSRTDVVELCGKNILNNYFRKEADEITEKESQKHLHIEIYLLLHINIYNVCGFTVCRVNKMFTGSNFFCHIIPLYAYLLDRVVYYIN